MSFAPDSSRILSQDIESLLSTSDTRPCRTVPVDLNQHQIFGINPIQSPDFNVTCNFEFQSGSKFTKLNLGLKMLATHRPISIFQLLKQFAMKKNLDLPICKRLFLKERLNRAGSG